MNTADLITAFFNNEMSPDQERQFLLSVASSDSMRLGLKSHVMLDKLLQEQVELTTVPPMVRTTILREAAVVAAAAASGVAASEAEAAMIDDEPVAGPSATPVRPSLLSRIPRWTAYPMSLLLAVGGYFVGLAAAEENEVPASVIESTPLLEPTEENVALPADDPLGETEASVVETDDAPSSSGDRVMTTAGESAADRTSRQDRLNERANGRGQNGTVPTVPSLTPSSPVGNTASDTLNSVNPNRVNFGSLNVSKPDSTK